MLIFLRKRSLNLNKSKWNKILLNSNCFKLHYRYIPLSFQHRSFIGKRKKNYRNPTSWHTMRCIFSGALIGNLWISCYLMVRRTYTLWGLFCITILSSQKWTSWHIYQTGRSDIVQLIAIESRVQKRTIFKFTVECFYSIFKPFLTFLFSIEIQKTLDSDSYAWTKYSVFENVSFDYFPGL